MRTKAGAGASASRFISEIGFSRRRQANQCRVRWPIGILIWEVITAGKAKPSVSGLHSAGTIHDQPVLTHPDSANISAQGRRRRDARRCECRSRVPPEPPGMP